MNGFTNPYTDRRYGSALSATQGFLNSYMQYRQILSQEKYRESLMGLHKKQAEWYERRPSTTTSIKIFSPAQGARLGDKAAESLSMSPSKVLPEDYKLFTRRSRERHTIGDQDALKAYEDYRRRIGYDYLSPAQQEQADTEFDLMASQGFAEEWDEKTPETQIQWNPNSPEVQSMRPYSAGRRMNLAPSANLGQDTNINLMTGQPRRVFSSPVAGQEGEVLGERAPEGIKFKSSAAEQRYLGVPPELTPYWDSLSPEDREDILAALRRNPDALEEILRRLQQ